MQATKISRRRSPWRILKKRARKRARGISKRRIRMRRWTLRRSLRP